MEERRYKRRGHNQQHKKVAVLTQQLRFCDGNWSSNPRTAREPLLDP